MDMSRLTEIDACTWSFAADPREGRREARLYGTRELVAAMDDKVLEQIGNVARLPGLVGCAMAMPDAHWGYGFPIGGVAAFDPKAGGIISAGGVGFDISCGIRCLRTALSKGDILPVAHKLSDGLFRDIPAGVGEGGDLRLTVPQLDRVLTGGARWAVAEGFGEEDDLEYVEDNGCATGADPSCVSPLAKSRQLHEMGTLGSGNHYLEVQWVERVHDEESAAAYGIAEGQIVISIHCGSRGLGHQIGTDFLVSLAKAASRLGIDLPDRELACAPILSPEGEQYFGAMNAGINCALANRQILTHITRGVLRHFFRDARVETLFDVSHNTCKPEPHEVDGKRRILYVHRKGATRAFGPGHPALPEKYRKIGQPVIIPGDMGRGSYLLVGTALARETFYSTCHGAGRLMSRSAAIRAGRGRSISRELEDRGIIVKSTGRQTLLEEMPEAYKDVNQVVSVVHGAGISRRVCRMRPLGVIKG